MTGRSIALMAGVVLGIAPVASASIMVTFDDPGGSGLSAEAEFSVVNPTTLEVRLKNTSTGVPGGFNNADQILTGVSWDFGVAGLDIGDITITGGSVFTGPTSMSIDFDIMNVGPNEDVSGEWGYGNMDTTGLLMNLISTVQANATMFPGANLDGPVEIDGPQGGLVADPVVVPLGGLGVIQDEVIATLTLSGPITEAELLDDLLNNGVLVEFGSDAAFIYGVVPTPGVLALMAMAGVVAARPRRRRE
jgi:hypothetical protein